jgi:hypothetical protein
LKKQILVAAGAVIVLGVLYFGFSNKPPKVSAFDEKRTALLDSLEIPTENSIVAIQAALEKDPENIGLLDSLSHLWFHAGFPAIAADYDRQIADLDPSVANYIRSGKSFFDAFPSDTTQTMQVNLVYGARYCYEKALELDSTNIDARIGLASVFVQGTNEPMKGITLLRELDQEVPGNTLINMELGRFSMMSGQYEKAIERFIVVLQKDSLNLQAHFLLAESYMAVGDTLQSVEALRRTQGLTGDPVLDNQVSQYIESLTN